MADEDKKKPPGFRASLPPAKLLRTDGPVGGSENKQLKCKAFRGGHRSVCQESVEYTPFSLINGKRGGGASQQPVR